MWAKFDQWLEAHYVELVRVAARRVNFDPEDVVQAAILSILANRTPEEVMRAPWTYCVNRIRAEAGVQRRSAARRHHLHNAAAGVAEIAGYYPGRGRVSPHTWTVRESTGERDG